MYFKYFLKVVVFKIKYIFKLLVKSVDRVSLLNI